MKFYGFLGTSFIDFPGKLASVLFAGGCNFRCPFCHNPLLVNEPLKPEIISGDQMIDFLNKRKGFIDGVVITGGEPLIHQQLMGFLEKVFHMGYSIKLDTNGYFPRYLERILKTGWVDYIAMDVKTSEEKYPKVVGKRIDFQRIHLSIQLIMEYAREYEFRTTVVPGLVDKQDVLSISKLISGAKNYMLQQFNPDVTLTRDFKLKEPYDKNQIESFAEVAHPFVSNISIRSF